MTAMTTKIDSNGDRALFEERMPGATHWSHILKRGTTLRITDSEGGANVSALFYNADNLIERYNMPDTLKAQHIAYLTTGRVCYSDMGRILVSLTGDTCGWHDTITGHSLDSHVKRKYGEARYQEHRNAFHRSSRELLLIELAKYGLGKADIVPNVNFFTRIAADENGELRFVPENSKAGAWVDLRAEMNTLVVLTTCQHPMDPNPQYAPRPVHLAVRRSPAPGPDDPCRLSRPENGRGFINTERYFL